jgi:hypothetical protein
MNSTGPTKNTRLRPKRSVNQPPRKPPKKIPINAEAAIMPCQKLLRARPADICTMATPMLST